MLLKFLCAMCVILLFGYARADSPPILEWDSNPEPDVAGYRVYAGYASRQYSIMTDAGPSTSLVLSNLVPGKKHFLAVTAYTPDGLESPFSDELWYVVPATINLPFWYDFRVNGVLSEALSQAHSTSAYWWLQSGGRMTLSNGVGQSIAAVNPADPFQLLLRKKLENSSIEAYFLKKSGPSSYPSKAGWNGISLFARYTNELSYYFASIRADGNATIRKRKDGVYYTLIQKKVFPGTYAADSDGLIPTNAWIGLRLTTSTQSGITGLAFHADIGRSGDWKLLCEATDDPLKHGPSLDSAGLCGTRSDFPVLVDDFRASDAAITSEAQPQMLAQPSLLVEDDSSQPIPFALRIRGFDEGGKPCIEVTGPRLKSFVLERSVDLVQWDVVYADTLGEVEAAYCDLEALQKCFYRVVRKD